MINFIIRIQLSRAGKQVPVQCTGDTVCLFRSIQSLRPDRTVSSTFHLSHFTDFAIPYPFANQIRTFIGCPLITHLSDNTGRSSQLSQQTGLINRVSQRFLTEYVLAHCHRISSNNSMSMVGSSNNYPIDRFTHFIVHLPIVPIFLCFRKFVEHTFCISPVHIAKSHNVFSALHLINIGMSHAANTHGCKIQFITGSHMTVTHS